MSLQLKKRASALPLCPKFIPHKVELNLRSAKFWGSDHLFPQEKFLEAVERKKAAAQYVLYQAIKLGFSTLKHMQHSSPAPSSAPCPFSQLWRVLSIRQPPLRPLHQKASHLTPFENGNSVLTRVTEQIRTAVKGAPPLPVHCRWWEPVLELDVVNLWIVLTLYRGHKISLLARPPLGPSNRVPQLPVIFFEVSCPFPVDE